MLHRNYIWRPTIWLLNSLFAHPWLYSCHYGGVGYVLFLQFWCLSILWRPFMASDGLKGYCWAAQFLFSKLAMHIPHVHDCQVAKAYFLAMLQKVNIKSWSSQVLLSVKLSAARSIFQFAPSSTSVISPVCCQWNILLCCFFILHCLVTHSYGRTVVFSHSYSWWLRPICH